MEEKQQRMIDIVKLMKLYVDTYSNQKNYYDCSDDTFIKDMLYGIGIAIDYDTYSYEDGYEKFKKVLANVLREI